MAGRWDYLVRPLSLAALIVAAPAALVVSGWWLTDYVSELLLDWERESTAGSVHDALARSIGEEALREPATEESSRGIAAAGRMLRGSREAVRIKVFDREGTVLWSDEPGLVGANFRTDARVERSLAGAPSAALELIGATPEHAFEVGRYRMLTSVYVPITVPGTGRVALVFEVYKLPDALHARLRQSRFVVWAMALGTGAVLLVSQISLARGAGKTIARRDADLARRAAQLAALRQELGKAQQQLVVAERLSALGEAAAEVAHGLRNPLASIRALAQEAGEGLSAGDPLGQSLADIVQQVDRLEVRLRAVLASARPPEPGGARGREHVASLVRGAVAAIAECTTRSGATVELDVPDDLPEVLGDRAQIEQALQEILTNGAEAGAHRLRVSARADAAAAGIDLRIEDDGCGLVAHATTRAFDLFFTTKPGGTGVGLTAARRIVQEHGGAISIEPGRDRGAIVTVRLPAAAAGESDA